MLRKILCLTWDAMKITLHGSAALEEYMALLTNDPHATDSFNLRCVLMHSL
jgi:hypothetical protein